MTDVASKPLTRTEAAALSPSELRSQIATGRWSGPTLGLALGYLQTNLAIVPRDLSFDFLLFCTRNPSPCPVVEVTDVGDPAIKDIAPGSDLRTDLPRYRVFENGEVVDEPNDITRYWRDDAVGFLLGCSLTFEAALLAAGVPLRHLETGRNAPVYTTNVECTPAGNFSAPLVVSMRPIPAALVSRAVQITSRYPWGHGAPVHVGDPASLGIEDLNEVDFGESPTILPGDVPVFWGCGITPQLAAARAKPAYMITHYPEHMHVADRLSEADAVS